MRSTGSVECRFIGGRHLECTLVGGVFLSAMCLDFDDTRVTLFEKKAAIVLAILASKPCLRTL